MPTTLSSFGLLLLYYPPFRPPALPPSFQPCIASIRMLCSLYSLPPSLSSSHPHRFSPSLTRLLCLTSLLSTHSSFYSSIHSPIRPSIRPSNQTHFHTCDNKFMHTYLDSCYLFLPRSACILPSARMCRARFPVGFLEWESELLATYFLTRRVELSSTLNDRLSLNNRRQDLIALACIGASAPCRFFFKHIFSFSAFVK